MNTVMNYAYINFHQCPPKFYCRKYTNVEHPPENDKGWYCTKQCFDCTAEVGAQREKTNRLINKQKPCGVEDNCVIKMEKGLNFGQAVEAMKTGRAVSREGWNGKGMCVSINWGSSTLKTGNDDNDGEIEGIKKILFVPGPEGSVTRLPNIDMKAATGSTVRGWLASQTDILAEDWCILD